MRHCGQLGKHLDFPIQEIASMIITINTVKLKLLNPRVVESAHQSLSRLVEGWPWQGSVEQAPDFLPWATFEKMEAVAP